MEIDTQIKNIDRMLEDKTLPQKMRKDLERRKDILLNDKTVLK